MSRIGILPIEIPQGVNVTISDDNVVVVKGPKGELKQKVDKDITLNIEGNHITVSRPTEQKRHKAMHGLYRSLVNNMVHGVSQGYKVEQELVGVGYRAEAKGQILELSLGFSHDIHIQIPNEITISTKTERRANPIITMESADKQLIGHVAAKIRSLRAPEPYKGKGIRFVGEVLRRKAGKSASA
ncbi:MAG: 50S ribosomal protein L6 [Bacteroidales bacterium]|nr:50S ribosomal protein L6 [Bacteroidales bacterium]MCB8999236.1 50S ribosomal protein L6 [Bacteroidales bacterium]MCB9013096.1 50S ribosomal protein L6 [Bacteroidales bacterium]